MIDLDEVRALAEAARADTSDGLAAREKLADVVDELLDMLGRPETTWGAQWLAGTGGVLPRDDERDAREFIANLPQNVRHLWRVVSRIEYRHVEPWFEVPVGAEARDE